MVRNVNLNNKDEIVFSGNNIEGYIQDIDTTNEINGKKVNYLYKKNNLVLDGNHFDMCFLGMVSCENITLKNFQWKHKPSTLFIVDCTNSLIDRCKILNDKCIYFFFSSNNKITNCIFFNNSAISVYLRDSTNNKIINCTLSCNSETNICIWSSSNNQIINCTISNNSAWGVYLFDSSNNQIINCTIFKNSEYGIYLLHSTKNQILNCKISNSWEGIKFYYFSTDNQITNCIISNNTFGVFIHDDHRSNNNLIHHNDFIDNKYQGNEYGKNNFWDNGTQGNFWSDYNGTDADGDGIGDSFYQIIGEKNQDNYPLVFPLNIKSPIAKFKYLPIHPSNLDVTKFLDMTKVFFGEIAYWNWSFGEGNASYEQNPSHIYPPGFYNITLTITDEYGVKDNYSADIAVSYQGPPKIFHTPIAIGMKGKPINVLTKITDDEERLYAYLFYRKTGTNTFIKIMMEKKGENYIAEIPAEQVTTAGIEYYIFATDGKNNATHPSENPETNPHKFTVNSDLLKNRSDLSISAEDITFSKQYPKEGEKITIFVNISNIGKVDAKNVKIALYNIEEFIETKTIEEINTGDFKQISFEFLGKKGINKIRILIDPENEILELNETNNEAFKEITFQKRDVKEVPIVIFLLIASVAILIILIFTINFWYLPLKQKE